MTSFSKNHVFSGYTDGDRVLISLYDLGGRADSTKAIRLHLDELDIPSPNSGNIGTCVKAWANNNWGAKVVYDTNIQPEKRSGLIVNIRLLSIDRDLEDKILGVLANKKKIQPSLSVVSNQHTVPVVANTTIDIADAILIRVSELLELEERISSGEFSVDKVKALEDTVEKTIAENNQLLDMIRKLNDEVQELNSKLDSKPNLSALDRFVARQQQG